MNEYALWVDRCDITQLSHRLFSAENMTDTLVNLLHANSGNSKTYLEKLVERSRLFEKWWAVKEKYWYRKWWIKQKTAMLLVWPTQFVRGALNKIRSQDKQ